MEGPTPPPSAPVPADRPALGISAALSTTDAAFLASYSRHPGRAAQRAVWLRQQAAASHQRGDDKEADHFDDLAGRYEAVLAHLGRCRNCGRTLRNPASVAAGIGPECARDHG